VSIPEWNDGRNPDWERATLRETPELDPQWLVEKRIDDYLFWMALIAIPILAYQLYWRI
jgi:hypothetical protein